MTGWIIIGISVLGIMGCILLLIATRKIFARQRKQLLETIEME